MNKKFVLLTIFALSYLHLLNAADNTNNKTLILTPDKKHEAAYGLSHVSVSIRSPKKNLSLTLLSKSYSFALIELFEILIDPDGGKLSFDLESQGTVSYLLNNKIDPNPVKIQISKKSNSGILDVCFDTHPPHKVSCNTVADAFDQVRFTMPHTNTEIVLHKKNKLIKSIIQTFEKRNLTE